MPFIQGTSSGVRTFATRLSDLAVGMSVHSVTSIASGGSSYSVGDILVPSTSASTAIAAQIRVIEVDGNGAATAVRVENAGLYNEIPGSPTAMTGGSGSGAELNLQVDLNGWRRLRAVNVNNAAQSASIESGGQDYEVGDIVSIEVTGDPILVLSPHFEVTQVDGGGAVQAVRMVDAGRVINPPTDPVNTSLDFPAGGGQGDGLQLTLTWGDAPSAETIREIAVANHVDPTGANDTMRAGWLTVFEGSASTLELSLFDSWDHDETWRDQAKSPPTPGQSGTPGENTAPCCPMTVNDPFQWWVSVTPRRILFVYRVGDFWGSGHVGHLDSLNGTDEGTGYVCGVTRFRDDEPTDVDVTGSSVQYPQGGTSVSGPAWVRVPESLTDANASDAAAPGYWRPVENSRNRAAISGALADRRAITIPGNTMRYTSDGSPLDDADTWQQDGLIGFMPNIIPDSGNPGAPTVRITPTPDSVDEDRIPVIPVTVFVAPPPEGSSDPAGEYDPMALGEIRGVFWIPATDDLRPGDEIRANNTKYLIVGRANNSEHWAMWAMETV